ncbi:MAG: hypothetical protein HC851_15100 [Acaryochloris sp. RU_4_1]|nr:hypothetical protein [Acaryochloris sp. RU_4_1]NJR56041.1 hypothetical protein [Acaryochloris sp. CRU_2_0]
MNQALPFLTVNRSFLAEFIAAEKPCCALGMVEVEDQQCGFMALRPEPMIPPGVTDRGFNLGHTLFGTSTYEVIHFAFEFYGFKTFNVLINPNNLIVQAVLKRMIETGDYFFFAIDEQTGIATAFRSEIGDDTLHNLTENWERIQRSSTTEDQYHQVMLKFAANPHPPGILLKWVCQDDIEYLDLREDRMDLTPA